MNEGQKQLIQKIVTMMVASGLAVEEEDEYYLTDACVKALASFPEGQHFLRLLREQGAVEMEYKVRGVNNES